MIEVVTAVLIRDGRMLLTQRDPSRSNFGLTWETPGGKIDPKDASPEAALYREMREELDVGCEIGRRLAVVELPDLATPCRVSFYQAHMYTNAVPRPIVALGLGWFTTRAILALELCPANAKIVNKLVAWTSGIEA